MLTEKDYCDYDTCVALRKLGFPRWELPYDILSKKYYLRLYEVQKWLREEKGIHIEIDRIGYPTGYGWQVSIVEMEYNLCKSVINNNNSYEEALLEGIKEAINKVVKGGKEMIDKDFINEIIERASEEGVCYNHKYECVYKLVQNYILQHDMEKEEK